MSLAAGSRAPPLPHRAVVSQREQAGPSSAPHPPSSLHHLHAPTEPRVRRGGQAAGILAARHCRKGPASAPGTAPRRDIRPQFVSTTRTSLDPRSAKIATASRYNPCESMPMAESEIVFAVQESPEGGYEARALGHAIFTQAETLEELKTAAQDAVRCHPPRRASRPSGRVLTGPLGKTTMIQAYLSHHCRSEGNPQAANRSIRWNPRYSRRGSAGIRGIRPPDRLLQQCGRGSRGAYGISGEQSPVSRRKQARCLRGPAHVSSCKRIRFGSRPRLCFRIHDALDLQRGIPIRPNIQMDQRARRSSLERPFSAHSPNLVEL